jgi:hypothetical protein
MPPNLSKINEMTDTLTKAQRKLAGNCVYCDVAEGQQHHADCAVILHQRLDKLERTLEQILFEMRREGSGGRGGGGIPNNPWSTPQYWLNDNTTSVITRLPDSDK